MHPPCRVEWLPQSATRLEPLYTLLHSLSGVLGVQSELLGNAGPCQ